MACRHFTDTLAGCCAQGVNYQQLAGGGIFYMVMRLPCLPISNRRGETARECKRFAEQPDVAPGAKK